MNKTSKNSMILVAILLSIIAISNSSAVQSQYGLFLNKTSDTPSYDGNCNYILGTNTEKNKSYLHLNDCANGRSELRRSHNYTSGDQWYDAVSIIRALNEGSGEFVGSLEDIASGIYSQTGLTYISGIIPSNTYVSLLASIISPDTNYNTHLDVRGDKIQLVSGEIESSTEGNITLDNSSLTVNINTLTVNGNQGLTGCYVVLVQASPSTIVDQFCYTNGILTGYTSDF